MAKLFRNFTIYYQERYLFLHQIVTHICYLLQPIYKSYISPWNFKFEIKVLLYHFAIMSLFYFFAESGVALELNFGMK